MNELGLGSIGATMAARVQGNTRLVITNVPWANPFQCIIALLPGNAQPQYAIVPFVRMVPGSHFPYGWNVEPDAPL